MVYVNKQVSLVCVLVCVFLVCDKEHPFYMTYGGSVRLVNLGCTYDLWRIRILYGQIQILWIRRSAKT